MTNCIKCSNGNINKASNFFCEKCGYLNIFQAINYFDYLDLSINLYVNLEDLEEKYLSLMMLYHPDKFINKDAQEQQNALLHSSFLNDAYNTLKNPILILAHLYKYFIGVDIIKAEMTINNPLISIEFLELYEELEQIENKVDLNNFVENISKNQNNLLDNLNKVDFKNITKEDEEILIMGYIKLKYISRVLEKTLLKNC
jgi:molecular chaperone HscB